jgi:cell division protease FtsH
VITEHLYVQVMAAAKRTYGGAASEPAPFYLPDSPRHVWLEVDLPAEAPAPAPNEVASANLLGEVVDAFAGVGATIDRRSFDVTGDGGGSSFSSSDGLFTTILVFYGPWILIFAVFLIVLRQMRGQGGAGGVMSFGRSRAQLYTKESRTNVTFDDVAGAEEAKAEVREIVEFLKNPGRFTRIGGRIPRGVLLVGPPGCGKTLLAKAIAGEAEVPFFSISGSDFVEMFVGVGASRVRDLFKQARENSPCIIFLDEIDAVGRRRGSGMGGGHDEREQTLNAILVEMDGFGTDEGIIVVAATNRPDVLDPALLRPGRFDREVTIDLPDMEGRRAILAVHLKRVKHASDVDVEVLARSSPGYSGADLAAIVNEAAIMAVLAKRDEIWMEDLEEARDKVRYGRQKRSRKIEEEDRKITAYHEAGHAVVAAVLEDVDHPHKVTIVPRGRALGSTMVLPEKESYHMQKKRLLGQLAVLFGGRVAEQEFCGDISAGASDDIRRATDLARTMVTELGMSDLIGPINYAERQGSDFLGTELMRGKTHSEDKANEIDGEVHRIVTEAYARTEEILRAHRAEVEMLTAALLELETINGEEITRLLGGASLDDLRRAREKAREVARAELGPPRATRQAEDQPHSGELPGEPGLYPA